MISRDRKRCPTHPGELLRDVILPSLEYGKTQFAKLPGISRQHFYDIVNERKPVSAPVAARLGKLFGNGSLFWIRMQGAYEAWHADREIDVSPQPTLNVGQGRACRGCDTPRPAVCRWHRGWSLRAG